MSNDISTQIRRGGAPSLYKDVYDVLQVSYDELPPHLKHCFLYLANFPEDYEIWTTKLYQLWVAEGIVVKENPNESEEGIAERYLNELVSRNMVQGVTWVDGTDNSTVRTCRLHDLMRDVCMAIANREGFVQVVNCHSPTMLLSKDKNTYRLSMTSLSARDKRLRRLAVYMGDQEPHVSTLEPTIAVSPSSNVSRAPNLRSLLLFSVNEHLLGGGLDCKRLMDTISEDYPLLRVFDCENAPLTGMLSKKVESLIHLRHLGLANTRVTELPESVEKLQWLQTLDLRVDPNVRITIPNVLWKMKQLKHIYLPDDGGKLRLAENQRNASSPPRYSIKKGGALRLDGLWNLQTLLNIDLDGVDINGLSKLARLKMVGAACESNNKALHPFLQCSSMKSFELTLHAQIIDEEPTILSSCTEARFQLHVYAKPYSNFRLRKPLCLEMFPKRLVSLGIWYLELDHDPLPVLEKLPYLANLRLIMCYGGQMMICTAGGFPQLTSLCFYKLRSFRYWEVEKGALCKLKSLLMVDCLVRNLPDALPTSVNVNIHGPG